MSADFELFLSDVRKTYGQRKVLDINALTLKSDCTYALVGPNGSGKSTFLKVLSGVTGADEGAAVEAAGVSVEQLKVGYMPQKSYVFGFSVFKNVAMALDSETLASDEVRRRVDQALADVGMEAFAQARGNGLSGGEAQRVALARILVRDLDVVLLDEPTASMDIAGTLLVEDALKRYRERTGCLLLAATHAPSQARRIADEVVMLADGQVVEQGSTDQVLAHPTSEKGREFLSYWTI